MNLADYEKASAELLALAKEIEDRKRPSYTNDHEDCLRNFKRDAAELGLEARLNWATHFQKQVSAILRWAKDPSAEQSEPMESRFGDAINYLKLGYALWREDDFAAIREYLDRSGMLARSDLLQPGHNYGMECQSGGSINRELDMHDRRLS